jgi:predicted O-methyltransferase YrrM
MRTVRHWSLRYIADRIALAIYERQNPDVPWLTKTMVQFLDCWLQASDHGVEFGSGRSTVWFAARVANLTSVEHDKQWSVRVQQMLRTRGLERRVTYRFADDNNLEASYLAVFSELPESAIDFFLIDGIFRDKCAISAIPKLRPGGLLIVDNANWYLPAPIPQRSPSSRSAMAGPASALWSEFARMVSGWRYVWTSNGVSDTACWVRPFSGQV